ncbi:MAG TPA: sugar transferase [Povalibacter sp.]|nr:sugar transferase [Povalibacter sp.]
MNNYPGKRPIDLVLSGIACTALAPLMAGIAAAVWLDDGGSPFFAQRRVGAQRESFTILKFRSMRDQRVTRVGHLLRRTGLDELPQMINVCRGDMSVVGPRPLTSEDVARLGWNDPRHDWRFQARPGITGLSQLLPARAARHAARLDRLYIQRQSPLLDLHLVALSFVANVIGKAAVRKLIHARRLL